MGSLLIGSHRAKLDKSGRLKIPEKFREAFEERWGKELLVTSPEGSYLKVFPLPVWLQLTGDTERENRFLDPDIEEFTRRANDNAIQVEIDAKGRVLLSPELRRTAGLEAEVKIIGLNNHLEVWNAAALEDHFQKRPLTRDDFKKIAELLAGRKGP